MGLVVFGAMAIYLIVSIAVVTFAAIAARKSGKNPWTWAGGAALAMYLLVFWDHIPTLLVHKYYCEKEAGFWVYKTMEQWKAENPSVMETLVSNWREPHSSQGNYVSYVDTYFLNQRFNMVVTTQGQLFLNRWRYERLLIDTMTSEVLGRYVDFSTSQERPQAGWSGWKFWLDSRYCDGGRENAIKSSEWINQFKGTRQ